MEVKNKPYHAIPWYNKIMNDAKTHKWYMLM